MRTKNEFRLIIAQETSWLLARWLARSSCILYINKEAGGRLPLARRRTRSESGDEKLLWIMVKGVGDNLGLDS